MDGELGLMSKNNIDSLIEAAGNEYASVVSDGVVSDVSDWLDTGSYMLNALISGSIFAGIPSNKVVGFAGEETVGKTFYVLSCMKSFLEKYPDGIVSVFETESALTREMIESRGIDSSRVAFFPVKTVQDFRTQAFRILGAYKESGAKYRMMMVLDSLGNLSTEKEIKDISEGNDTRDMTKSQLVKGAFRAITLETGMLNVPILITNHVYDVIGSYFPTKEIAGGSGLKYAASTIISLTKSKEKEGKEVVGALIKATSTKSRFTKENQLIETQLFFDSGLNRYHGLLEFAADHGIINKSGAWYEFPDGTKKQKGTIMQEPEKWFTEDFLNKVDAKTREEFMFGDFVENTVGDDVNV